MWPREPAQAWSQPLALSRALLSGSCPLLGREEGEEPTATSSPADSALRTGRPERPLYGGPRTQPAWPLLPLPGPTFDPLLHLNRVVSMYPTWPLLAAEVQTAGAVAQDSSPENSRSLVFLLLPACPPSECPPTQSCSVRPPAQAPSGVGSPLSPCGQNPEGALPSRPRPASRWHWATSTPSSSSPEAPTQPPLPVYAGLSRPPKCPTTQGRRPRTSPPGPEDVVRVRAPGDGT